MSWDVLEDGARVPGHGLASPGLSEEGRAGSGDCWGSVRSGAACCATDDRESREGGWAGMGSEGMFVRGLLPES